MSLKSFKRTEYKAKSCNHLTFEFGKCNMAMRGPATYVRKGGGANVISRKDTESGNAKCKMQNARCATGNRKMRNAKCKMHNAPCTMPDASCELTA